MFLLKFSKTLFKASVTLLHIRGGMNMLHHQTVIYTEQVYLDYLLRVHFEQTVDIELS